MPRSAGRSADPPTPQRPEPPWRSVDDEFSDFYRSFFPKLAAFLVVQGAGLADAADIAQEAMIQTHQQWDKIIAPKAWTRRVASRAYIKRMAANKEHPVDIIPEPSHLFVSEIDEATFDERHEILKLLSLLPQRQRQVMAWTIDGYGPSEIAQELKIAADTVRASLMKARHLIATHLQDRNGDSR